METKLTVEGVELEVEYSTFAGYRGARDSLGGVPNAGPPLEPDENPSVEIEDIKHCGITIFHLLSEEVIEKIYDMLWTNMSEDDYEPSYNEDKNER